MMMHGTYKSFDPNEEFAFCLSMAHDEPPFEWPEEIKIRMEDLGTEEYKGEFWIPRVRMAECIQELKSFSYPCSPELTFWIRLYDWARSLAIKGQFYPGMAKEGDLYLSKWLVDWTQATVQDEAEEWMSEGHSYLSGFENPWKGLRHFAEDTVDSYIRLVINTQFSLNRSQLGKLLKFKPFYLHEEWLQNLCMEEHVLASGDRWAAMFQSYKEWRGEKPEADEPEGRLCLRLEPPVEGEEWGIGFYWMDVSGNLMSWDELKENKSLFLHHLARAAETFPPLTEDFERSPFWCSLTTEQAYHFLKQAAPALRTKGFAVLVPRSMLRSRSRLVHLRLQLDPDDRVNNGELGLQSLLSFRYQVALGEQELSAEEWEHITSSQAPLFQKDGEWVLLDQDELRRSAQWVNKYQRKKELTLRDALHLYAYDGDDELLPMRIESIQAKGWVQDWFSWLQGGGTIQEFPISSLFRGTLRPYQQVGMSWLIQLRNWNMGACLADDMGLGKTIQFLSYLALCKEKEWLKRPFLLICPTSVLGNWQREIHRFMPSLTVLVHHGPARFSGEQFAEEAEQYDLVLTTYSIVQRDQQLLAPIQWEGVALDEAQHIKNTTSQQTKAIRKLRANHRIALTGTPMENRLQEMWSIFEFLNPGYLGSHAAFRREFVTPIEKLQDPRRKNSLKRLIRPFLLRRSKADPEVISDLPKKIETKEYCTLTTEQAALYERVVKDLMEKEKSKTGLARKGLILSTILKLKQICNHPSLFLHLDSLGTRKSGKLQRLLDMTEEMVNEGDRILIFTQFAKMGLFLKQELEAHLKVKIPFLSGASSTASRDEMIQEFQQDEGGPPIFLLSLKAGGVGLNLTRANQVIHFDRWWNPAVENQATDRAYRIGQTRTVYVHKLVCMGTIEEKIDQMIERKQGLVADMMGGGEGWVTELSSDELKDLLSLHNQLIDDF